MQFNCDAGQSRKQNFARWRQQFPNTVTMFTTARGWNRTFYFPPANCLISCCRWRARCTVGEQRRPRLAQELTHSLHLSETLLWLQASPSLWSFVEIPNRDIWRCLSTVPFLSSPFFSPLRHLKLLFFQCLSLFVLKPSPHKVRTTLNVCMLIMEGNHYNREMLNHKSELLKCML